MNLLHLRSLFFFSLLPLFSKGECRPISYTSKAPHVVLMNADTEVVLYQKNGDKEVYPASTTKIATALYALYLKGDQMGQLMPVSSEALKCVSERKKTESNYTLPGWWLESDGAFAGLIRNEKLSGYDLLHATMLRSGNDAANMLAIYSSGSVPKFMEGMNSYLKRMGLKKTHFENPHGLFMPSHKTTAMEMALLAKEAMNYPLLRKVAATVSYPRPRAGQSDQKAWIQGNRLLRKGKHHYPKAIGLKTGYTSKSKHNIVAVAEHQGRRLIASIFECSKREEIFEESKRLFELAFSEKLQKRSFFTKETLPFSHNLRGGEKSVEVVAKSDIEYQFYPSEEQELRCFVEWEQLTLPVEKGELVGTLTLHSKEHNLEVAHYPLYAKERVERRAFFSSLLNLNRLELSNPLIFFTAIFFTLTIFTAFRGRRG